MSESLSAPFKAGDRVVALDTAQGLLVPGQVYTVSVISRQRHGDPRVIINGLYADGRVPCSGLEYYNFRAAVAGQDYDIPKPPITFADKAEYLGHCEDGSSVQKHSAGGLYPYTLSFRDNQDPHSKHKYDVGLTGPRIVGTTWLRSVDHAVEVALALKK